MPDFRKLLSYTMQFSGYHEGWVGGTHLGCGMGPDLSTARDVQRVIELLIHLVKTPQHQGNSSSLLPSMPESRTADPPTQGSAPPPATRSPRKLQLPKNPGAKARAPQGGPPPALLGGVVPGLRATTRTAADRLCPGAALLSPPGWQSRSGSAGLAGGPAASAGAAPHCAGAARGAPPLGTRLRGGGGAQRHKVRDAEKHGEMRPEAELRASADGSRERQPSPSRTPAESPGAGETAAGQAPCAPGCPYAHRKSCAVGAPPGPAKPTDPPTPTNRGAPPRPPPLDLPAHPPGPGWGGAGTGVRDAGRGRWAGPPGALTPLQPQRLHQRSHVCAAAAVSRPPARSPARGAGLGEATPRAAGAPCGGAARRALSSGRRDRPTCCHACLAAQPTVANRLSRLRPLFLQLVCTSFCFTALPATPVSPPFFFLHVHRTNVMLNIWTRW